MKIYFKNVSTFDDIGSDRVILSAIHLMTDCLVFTMSKVTPSMEEMSMEHMVASTVSFQHSMPTSILR